MPGSEEFRRGLLQFFQLVLEYLHGELAVEKRVVYLAPDQGAVLVVLDQPVVWPAREGYRIQAQGVDGGQVEQLQVRVECP